MADRIITVAEPVDTAPSLVIALRRGSAGPFATVSYEFAGQFFIADSDLNAILSAGQKTALAGIRATILADAKTRMGF